MADRRSPLFDTHVRMGAQMIKGGGDYWFPQAYTSPVEEHVNVRNAVGMQDLTSMGEVDIKGPGAERLLNSLLVNEVRDLEPGQIRYSTICREDGGIVDDITVYKFNDEHFMVVTSSGPRKRTFRWIADHAVGTGTYVTDVSGSIALPVVQGQRSRELLLSLVSDADVAGLKFFRFVRAEIEGVPVILSRSGYTGELGFELYTPAEEAVTVWETVHRRGKEFGLLPYGVTAMQSLRVEKALPLYGKDITEEVTPFHVGLDKWIRFDKRTFVGRDALLRVQERGLDRRWVGLVLNHEVAAPVDAPVHGISEVATQSRKKHSGADAGAVNDSITPGEPVGQVTISVRGHSIGKVIAMAYVSTSHSWPGCKLAVMIAGRPVPAVVTATPFFDPQGARLRAKTG